MTSKTKPGTCPNGGSSTCRDVHGFFNLYSCSLHYKNHGSCLCSLDSYHIVLGSCYRYFHQLLIGIQYLFPLSGHCHVIQIRQAETAIFLLNEKLLFNCVIFRIKLAFHIYSFIQTVCDLGIQSFKAELCKVEKQTFWADEKVKSLGYGEKDVLPFYFKQILSEEKLHELRTVSLCRK